MITYEKIYNKAINIQMGGDNNSISFDAIEGYNQYGMTIKTMDNQNGLYLVKQNNVYGIVNSEGQILIEPEYKQIGVNIDKYVQNGVESKYILLDRYEVGNISNLDKYDYIIIRQCVLLQFFPSEKFQINLKNY